MQPSPWSAHSKGRAMESKGGGVDLILAAGGNPESLRWLGMHWWEPRKVLHWVFHYKVSLETRKEFRTCPQRAEVNLY